MQTGIIMRWGSPRPGRERESLELYREATQLNTRLVSEGKLTFFEPFFLSSGDSEVEAGFFIMKGEVADVFALLDSQEFRDQTSRASLLLEHFRIDMLTVGEGIERGMADFQRAIAAVAR